MDRICLLVGTIAEPPYVPGLTQMGQASPALTGPGACQRLCLPSGFLPT